MTDHCDAFCPFRGCIACRYAGGETTHKAPVEKETPPEHTP